MVARSSNCASGRTCSPMTELTKPYEPNAVLRALYARWFDHIRVDPAWAHGVREDAVDSTIIYVLRNLSFVDYLALDHVTKRYQLPRIRFANDMGSWLFDPFSPANGPLSTALRSRRPIASSNELRDALQNFGSAALFLKRPPSVLDVAAGVSGGRGSKEGDELVRTLFAIQRSQQRPIVLLPLLFVWTQQPDTRGRRALDFLLGPPEWPNTARTLAQFLVNYNRVSLKAGEPLNLRDFLDANEALPDDVLTRRVSYATLRRLERERRSITGPAARDPERVRFDIVRGPRLRALIDDLSSSDPGQRHVLTHKALEMLRALQARPDPIALRASATMFDRLFRRLYAGLDVLPADMERLREATKKGTLVLLPSHKSHIDYLILSYTFYENNLPLPMIAAGENLNFFPVGPLFRRSGAFFIRRSFGGDRLYAAVVDGYVRRVLRDGYPIELFIEGGRSRTGKLLTPRFGLLSMVVDAVLALPQNRMFFVPVSIGYERVMETDSYQRELTGGEKQKEDAAVLLRAPKLLRHGYGRLNIRIGQLLTLSDIRRELGLEVEGPLKPAKRRAVVTRLANQALDEINRVTAVTPGALTALALLTHSRRGLTHEELVDRCRMLLRELQDIGARCSSSLVTPSGALRPEALREAVQMFADAEMLEAHATGERDLGRRRRVTAGEGAIYTIPHEKRFSLDTSKNIIIHFFVERALVAMALLSPPGPPVELSLARERVQTLARLFKNEFRFRADASLEEVFNESVERLRVAGNIVVSDGALHYGAGRDGYNGEMWLRVYASILRNFVEGYRVAARSLSFLFKGALPEKDLFKRALGLGSQMFYAGEIERRESVSKSILQNAFRAFVELGYVTNRADRIALAERLNPEAVESIEAGIALYSKEVAW